MKQNYKYMVATRCFTYNHAPYIEDALRGFAMQKADFPMVFCIVDDASTDGEQNVLKKWAGENLLLDEGVKFTRNEDYGNVFISRHRDNPNALFVIVLLKENHYKLKKSKMRYVAEWLNEAKYHALCEGDDKWIHPQKLQLQYDFLESHPDYSCCYTCYKSYDEERKETIGIYGEDYRDVRQMLWNDVSIATASLFYRSEFWRDYFNEIGPSSSHGWMMGDKPLFFYLGYRGLTKLLPEVTIVYRILTSSASHSSNIDLQLKRARNTIDIYHYFANKYFPEDKTLSKRIEGGYLYRAYYFHRTLKVKYPKELKRDIFRYHGSYHKLYIVKLMLLFPFLEKVLYSLTSLRDNFVVRLKSKK